MGRGSAKPAMAVVLALIVLVCLVFESQPAQAAIFYVGGRPGWTFNTASWTNGKSFKAGDVLVFNYDRTQHNVVKVDRRGYSSCSSPRGANVMQSGKDRVRLAKGQNFFICSYPGHCQGGMKIAVTAN
ncbi:hypothetical protein V2J09_009100 [Rumex salicifolius]